MLLKVCALLPPSLLPFFFSSFARFPPQSRAFLPTPHPSPPFLLLHLKTCCWLTPRTNLATLGPPIVCQQYDLREALLRENEARIQREDSGVVPEGEEADLEYPPHLASVPKTPFVPPPPPTKPARPSASARSNSKKRDKARSKRQQAACAAEAAIDPPAPNPRVLKKAAASSPIKLALDAADFRASHPRWTGMPGHADHPLFVHARDAEYLKEHLQYADWQGEKTHVLLDKHGHVIGTLVAPPLPGKSWAPVLQDANKAVRGARQEMSFTESAHHHRRAFDEGEGFPSETTGMAFGGGRKEPGNVKASSARNGRAMDKLVGNHAIRRMCTFPVGPFQALCNPIFSKYHRTKQQLRQRQPGLRSVFPKSPFATS
ncbi:hypothetical protein FB45DRAFT_881005 [Roridomyces roridus]|uniref:Uncharacterized protein n=1 Tax=Roridomyces roridus TaxID=1738132 RepID=A0AAD7F8F9_9AGAR|nr:hypothetical protein FB45DRAFT_881005 [Roridomyces roridus]